MLKSLYPEIDWEPVEVVGFDVDGTLYDECEFASGAYGAAARHLAGISPSAEEDIHTFLIRRWLEKGSSYPKIFREAIERFIPDPAGNPDLEMECVEQIRSHRPRITLNTRVELLLNVFAEQYDLFVVTDGREKLQGAKLESLDVKRWVKPERTVITGALGAGLDKPSTAAAEHLGLTGPECGNGRIVFFGDRPKDREFARRAGFQFQGVKVMEPACVEPYPEKAPA